MPNNNSHLNHPVYWFVVLETARERSDFSAAAHAQEQLKRLGVRVRYERNQKREAAQCQ